MPCSPGSAGAMRNLDFAVVQNSSEIIPRWMVESQQPSDDDTRVRSADSRKRSGPSEYGIP
ncbi:hypothetical protein Mal15_50370 [Stieleria maiorica]|uniref:Uncharacterized protein n=1 Tax=Stieleria maiorica TaxID=2795974 RepID=A0A5B9MLS6_9BACT|nr:hypothetical protein Mal15_50370 [Stieleria maiorica]